MGCRRRATTLPPWPTTLTRPARSSQVEPDWRSTANTSSRQTAFNVQPGVWPPSSTNVILFFPVFCLGMGSGDLGCWETRLRERAGHSAQTPAGACWLPGSDPQRSHL